MSSLDILDLLIREKRLSEAKAKEKFRQLVLAVEYIHSKNIVSFFSPFPFNTNQIVTFRFIVSHRIKSFFHISFLIF